MGWNPDINYDEPNINLWQLIITDFINAINERCKVVPVDPIALDPADSFLLTRNYVIGVIVGKVRELFEEGDLHSYSVDYPWVDSSHANLGDFTGEPYLYPLTLTAVLADIYPNPADRFLIYDTIGGNSRILEGMNIEWVKQVYQIIKRMIWAAPILQRIGKENILCNTTNREYKETANNAGAWAAGSWVPGGSGTYGDICGLYNKNDGKWRRGAASIYVTRRAADDLSCDVDFYLQFPGGTYPSGRNTFFDGDGAGYINGTVFRIETLAGQLTQNVTSSQYNKNETPPDYPANPTLWTGWIHYFDQPKRWAVLKYDIAGGFDYV